MNTKLKTLIASTLLVVSAMSTTAISSQAQTQNDSAKVAANYPVVTDDYELIGQVIELAYDGNFSEANALTDEAIRKNPNNASAYYAKEQILLKCKGSRWQELVYLNQAIAIAPNYDVAISAKADLMQELNNDPCYDGY